MTISNFAKTILISIILIPSISSARWAMPSEADIEYEFYNRNIEVESDYTYTETIEFQAKILTESARNYFANYIMTYNADAAKTEILEAKTIVEEKEHIVDKDLIEDKPIKSSPYGFDQNNQILIAFPKADIGSKIYLKYKEKRFKLPAPEHFFTRFIYGYSSYWKNSLVKVVSKKPFVVDINDPEKVLEVEKKEDKGQYYLTIKLVKPVIKQLKNESISAESINYKHLPWVNIAATDKAQKVAKMFTNMYEQVLQEDLPKSYLEIVEKAKEQKNIKDQINIVTSIFAEQVRYMGDWRTVKGEYAPRSLVEVASNQLGDCKDFASGVVVILRNLGLKANVALVYRGEGHYDGPTKLESLYDLNHAICWVQTPEGVLWIDPTNSVSMAGELFPDIADKMALVLDDKNPRREKIPPIDYNEAESISEQTWDLSSEEEVKITGTWGHKKEQALKVVMRLFGQSEESIKYQVIDYLFSLASAKEFDVKVPPISRIVKDLSFSYSVTTKNRESLTTAGIAMSLINDFFQAPVKEQESDLYLGYPMTGKMKVIFNNIKPVATQNLDVKINSPWFDFDRKVTTLKDSVIIESTYKQKKSWIYREEFDTDEFKKVLKTVERHVFNSPAIVYTR